MKLHVKSIQKGSKADQYVVQNLTGSGVYLRSNLSEFLLQKVLTLVPLTATGPAVYVTTMKIFLSDYYDTLEKTITHKKSLKIKSYTEENVADCCAAILVYVDRLESAGAFKSEHLIYITCIFEDTSDSRFSLWESFK